MKWTIGVPSAYLLWFVAFFSPILFKHRLFPSDGQLAAFYTNIELWNPLPLAGMPGVGEPHLQQLYPLRWLFAALPSEIGFNFFIVFSYVFASSFTFGYVITVTRSAFAATIAGFIFGMSGYMIAHLGHTGLVPAAAWLPLILWALEKLRQQYSATWFVIGVLAIATVIVAGHPQAFVYSIYLATCYALFLGSTAKSGWGRFVGMFTVLIGLGSALAAAHILPMIELGQLSVRSALTFDDFKELALPVKQVPILLFPYLFGGGLPPTFSAYFGYGYFSEVTGYVGLITLMLAGAGAYFRWRDSIGAFWLGTALITFLLALGDTTPLLYLTYLLPVINKLRAPARHFHEMSLAFSVLAALGIHALQVRSSRIRVVSRIVAVGAIMMILSLVVIRVFYTKLETAAIAGGVVLPSYHLNPSLGIPIFAFAISSFALVYWVKDSTNRFRKAVLVAALLVDLGSFAWFAEWRYGSPDSILATPDYVAKYRHDLEEHRQRLMPMLGWQEPLLGFSPMMSQFYGLPSTDGYGPLLLKRYADVSLTTNGGWTNPSVLLSDDRSADLLAMRFVALPNGLNAPLVVRDGIRWSEQNLSIGLGKGCSTNNPRDIAIRLPRAVRADRISIVSKMACSTDLQQGETVAIIAAISAEGTDQLAPLRAGLDTSEWAIDCTDVQPLMRHARAPLFDSWNNVRPGFPPCSGHTFVSDFPLQGSSFNELTIKWLPDQPNVLAISKITLTDSITGGAYAVSESDLLRSDIARWEHIEDIGSTTIYRNLRAMARAWLVPEVVYAKAEDILQAIRTSAMPDGRIFDPRKVAFVEEPLTFSSREPDEHATAQVIAFASSSMEIETHSKTPTFLVLSDVFYPGWSVRIDGIEATLFRTDYTLRGVALPAGSHLVKLRFQPRIFYLGVFVSGGALFVLVLAVILMQRRQLALD